MKIRIIFFFAICIFLLSSGISHSQQDTAVKKILINKDTIEIGNYYSFYIANKEAFLGKVVAVNKNSILVYYDREIRTIDIMDIVMIGSPGKILFDVSVSKKKTEEERTYWMFGGGMIFTRPKSYYSGSLSNGFNLSAHSFVTFSTAFGLRADVDYIHIPKEDYQISNNSYPGTSTSYFTGGTINGILTKFNVAFGYFDPESLINAYFTPGIGVGGFYKTKETTTYYNSYYSPVYFSNSTDGSKLYYTIGLSAGLGLNVKVNKNIRVFSEYQFNTWTSNIANFNCLKAGVIIRGK